MLKCISKITITPQNGKPFEFSFINDVTVTTSHDKLTDTAVIAFPRNINYDGKNVFVGKDAIFKRKDKIKIELGYSPKLRTIFEGYITRVGASNPVIIECEDKMFLLKNTNITYPPVTGTITTGKNGKLLKKPINVTEKISLNQLLDYVLCDLNIEYKIIVNNPTGTAIISDVDLGNVSFTKVSVTEILDTLKSEYGLYSYFTDGVLFVGLPANASKSNTESFAFEKTILNETVLEYQQADDLNLKIVAISMNSDNTKKQIEVGDSDGSQRTYYTYNANEAELKVFANAKLKEIKYTGYSGTILTFGEPFVRHGDIAKITSEKYPEQDGYYSIVGVTYQMSVTGGYRQTIDIGRFIGSAISNVEQYKVTG